MCTGRHRVVILDNHEVVRRGLTAFLNDQPDFEVVGAAHGIEDFLRMVQEEQPEVALVDLRLANTREEETRPSGIAAIEQAKQLAVSTRYVIYSAYPKFGSAAIHAGASAYILKDMPMDRILETIWDVLKGKFVTSDEVIHEFQQPDPAGSELAVRLTERELELLQVWANDPEATEEATAQKLGIARGTVRTHRQNIYRKLETQSRAGAIVKAQKLGLV